MNNWHPSIYEWRMKERWMTVNIWYKWMKAYCKSFRHKRYHNNRTNNIKGLM